MTRKSRQPTINRKKAVQLDLPLGDVIIAPAIAAKRGFMTEFASSLHKKPSRTLPHNQVKGEKHDEY